MQATIFTVDWVESLTKTQGTEHRPNQGELSTKHPEPRRVNLKKTAEFLTLKTPKLNSA